MPFQKIPALLILWWKTVTIFSSGFNHSTGKPQSMCVLCAVKSPLPPKRSTSVWCMVMALKLKWQCVCVLCAYTIFKPHIHKHKNTQSRTHIHVNMQQCLTNEKHLSHQQKLQLVLTSQDHLIDFSCLLIDERWWGLLNYSIFLCPLCFSVILVLFILSTVNISCWRDFWKCTLVRVLFKLV